MRIVFMGTPDFAVESLKVLVENNYPIVGVVTMPDKPAGRGHKMQFSAVKQYALSKNLNLLQPERLKDEQFLQELKSLKADLQIVVAFRMLPEVVWNMPPMGTINLHASLLPQYRGAAPINWAIINGEKKTGVSTFFLTHEIDTGKIILQKEIAVADDENAGSVHDRLMHTGAQLLLETAKRIESGNVPTVDQSSCFSVDTELKNAPKLFRENCMLDPTKSVKYNYDLVRGLSPYPTAWTEVQLHENSEKMVLKVFETEIEYCNHNDENGTLVTDNKRFAKIAFEGGYLHLKIVQAPAKKRMEIGELLRGLKY